MELWDKIWFYNKCIIVSLVWLAMTLGTIIFCLWGSTNIFVETKNIYFAILFCFNAFLIGICARSFAIEKLTHVMFSNEDNKKGD